MTPARPDTPETEAAKKRLDDAVKIRDTAIEAAQRSYWATVKAEIEFKTLTQNAVAAHLGFSREHVRKQLIRYTADGQ
ncbi:MULTISPECIES: hypothetical protein [unclassified Streptomyces]|uniref:hypothetical protein n=1 Tax=unclassified Streptomyces TaxID=2593676 RepID=UPI000DC7D78F|nr:MULTISPECIES: hypothetical protein [unclassified Streptomyces]AWZ06875.1 hypothetical protein DRB89_22170 [Streptomyces sp. ICC4]AWZ14546.1 hypothetical protein DRB96_22360 [Streptomyces sp. ICC1]